MEESTTKQNSITTQSSESFKLAQALYNTVTGKTERISRRFTENYKIGMNDILQLHAKMGQMCAQWNVSNKSENITIHHVDDNKQVFSSLDRFKVYDQSQTSPIESIVYEFNLLIQLQNTPKPQPYKITVHLNSRVAKNERLKIEMRDHFFFRFFGGQGFINVDIEYVDYVVARNMFSTLDSWISTIDKTPRSKTLGIVRLLSNRLSELSSFVLTMIAIITVTLAVKNLDININNNELAYFLLASIGFIATSSFIGRVLGGFMENQIGSLNEISYIKINVGDERAIKAAEKNNFRGYVKTIISFLLVTIHAFSCSYFATIIYESMNP